MFSFVCAETRIYIHIYIYVMDDARKLIGQKWQLIWKKLHRASPRKESHNSVLSVAHGGRGGRKEETLILERLLRFPRRACTKTKKDEKKRIVFRLIAVMFMTRDGILMDRGRGSLRRNCPAGGPDRQICPAS